MIPSTLDMFLVRLKEIASNREGVRGDGESLVSSRLLRYLLDITHCAHHLLLVHYDEIPHQTEKLDLEKSLRQLLHFIEHSIETEEVKHGGLRSSHSDALRSDNLDHRLSAWLDYLGSLEDRDQGYAEERGG